MERQYVAIDLTADRHIAVHHPEDLVDEPGNGGVAVDHDQGIDRIAGGHAHVTADAEEQPAGLWRAVLGERSRREDGQHHG